MRKQPFFRSVSLVFLALAVFFICSSTGSYAADAKDVAAAESLMKAGMEAMQKDDLDKAMESFNKVLSLSVADSGAYNGLGNVYIRKGDDNKAIESFNKAISLNPKDVWAYVGLGNIYTRKGNAAEKAIESFNKAISLDAKNSSAYFGLGNLYLQKGDRDSALKQHKILSGLDQKMAEDLYKKIKST